MDTARQPILDDWLARIANSYPAQTARFLLNERDPFRNPVGSTFKENLPPLIDAVFGETDTAAAGPPLESMMRMRAVQDFTPGQAVGFLFLLKKVIRERLRPRGDEQVILENRIDELALAAFDLYVKCREQINEIKLNEARRSLYVAMRRGSS